MTGLRLEGLDWRGIKWKIKNGVKSNLHSRFSLRALRLAFISFKTIFKYDPRKHHRRSIRLKGYDYSREGLYFVTICIKDMGCLLGKITNEEMELNDAGFAIEKWWQKIPDKFEDIELAEYQIMPNHFHAIVVNVGADPRVCPDDADLKTDLMNDNAMSNYNDAEQLLIDPSTGEGEHMGSKNQGEHVGSKNQGEHMGSPLHRVIQWFKTMTTNEYIRSVKQNGWTPFNGKLWQRNYYEHIIRNEKSYRHIANYINNNPVNWKTDKFYKP